MRKRDADREHLVSPSLDLYVERFLWLFAFQPKGEKKNTKHYNALTLQAVKTVKTARSATLHKENMTTKQYDSDTRALVLYRRHLRSTMTTQCHHWRHFLSNLQPTDGTLEREGGSK